MTPRAAPPVGRPQGSGRSWGPAGRRRWLAAAAVAACTLSACTATATPDTDRLRSTRPGPTAGTPSTTTAPSGPASTAPAPSSPPAGCPTPAPATAAPTDFPHPELVRHPVAADTARADATLAQQGLTAVRLFGGPVATTAFQHYLDATGTYLTLPADGLLTAAPDLATELTRTLVATATDAVQQARAGADCTTVAFGSAWDGHAAVTDADWQFTLGRFYVRVLGTATRDGDTVRVAYRAAVGDTYDFDPDSTFGEFATLADHGRAAVYLTGGLTRARAATVTTAAELASPGFS